MKKNCQESAFPYVKESLAVKGQGVALSGVYVAPHTVRTSVATEGSFCGSVVVKTDDGNVSASEHQVQDFGSKDPFDFSGTSEWDN